MKRVLILLLIGVFAFSSITFAQNKQGYSVELVSVKQKLRTIGEIKALTGSSLKEAKVMVEGVPSLVLEGVSKDEAALALQRLTDTGAEVRLIEPIAIKEEAPAYLYVLNAESGLFDGETLVLNRIPFAVYSCEKPFPQEGHMDLVEFFKNWGTTSEEFSSTPQKATLSILKGDDTQNVLIQVMHPVLKGDIISCTVKVLEGKIPGSFGECSLLVDMRE